MNEAIVKRAVAKNKVAAIIMYCYSETASRRSSPMISIGLFFHIKTNKQANKERKPHSKQWQKGQKH